MYSEAPLTKSIYEVRAVPPNMVLLPEQSQTLTRIEDRWVLYGMLSGYRDQENCPAGWPKDAMEFTHRSLVVHDMLEHVTAIDHVEGAVRVINVGDIHLDHGTLGFQIRGQVSCANGA